MSIISVSLYLGKLDEGGILEDGKGEGSGPCMALPTIGCGVYLHSYLYDAAVFCTFYSLVPWAPPSAWRAVGT